MRFALLAATAVFLATGAKGEDHWAYLPAQKVNLAAGHPIDVLLAAAHDRAGLKAAETAPPRSWVARATLTLNGLPPRAMALADREKWSPAQIFIRGNPANRGETFEREWLGFLGGVLADVVPFPLFADGAWKTGPDLATAPIRWLHAGAEGGHAAAGHALGLRWRALGAGEVQMVGEIQRTQKAGVPLAWNLANSKSPGLTNHVLPPQGNAGIRGEWISVSAGDTLDFVLRAPEGDNCGGVAWKLRVLGRETPDAAVSEVGNFGKQFPTADSPPPSLRHADPWTDLIQMLWASNEFHFID